MFTFNLDDHKYKKLHFLGIGGVSMSGIALLMAKNGFKVSGSDRSDKENLQILRDNGIDIYIGQKKENIKDQDLFIYTDAILPDNEEYIAALETGKDLVSRGVFLGALMRNYKKSIAVSGSHGKSTTTSMISKMLVESPEDPTILLGGFFDDIKGNVLAGSRDFLLTEACEFKGNILHYYPSTAVILNISEDHLDYYRDLDHIIETFEGYMDHLDENSKVIINIDDENTHSLLDHIKGEAITFSTKNDKADYYAYNISYSDEGYPAFDLRFKDGRIERYELGFMGGYNIYNAMAAIAASYENGIGLEPIHRALNTYKPLHRRMEVIGHYHDATIMTDYAHHPIELQATLEPLNEHKKNRLVCVFQPHTFSRTKALLEEFGDSFYACDEVIVTDIFPAREKFDPTIHSKDLVDLLKKNKVNAKYIGDFEGAKEYIQETIKKDDLCLTTGCGDPDVLAKMIVE